MASLDTALTRLGLGGPSINYSRPFGAKAPSVPVHTAIGPGWIAGAWINELTVEISWVAGAWGVAPVVVPKQRIRGFTRNIGRLMNP